MKIFNISYNSEKLADSDTSITKQEVSFDSETSKDAIELINAIKSKGFNIEELQHTDAYQYETYLNDSLVARELCCDTFINKFLKKCLPYIDKQKGCSGFFGMISETN